MPQLHSQSLNLYAQFIQVRSVIAETTASFRTDLEIYSYLNQAQLYIQRKSKVVQKRVDVTTTTGTREYDLKTTTNSFYDIMDIDLDGVDFDLNGSTTNNQSLIYYPIWRLNQEFPGWRGVANSVPRYFYYKKATKTVGLYPEPNASNAGAYLHVNGYVKPKIGIAGTASAGTATTLTMAAGTSTVPYPNVANDYYNGLYFEIYGGTGAGQKLLVTDYVASTRKLTFATATSPGADSTFGFVPEIPEEAHYLQILYAIAKAFEKGGSRTQLANNYWQQFEKGLALFMAEVIEEDDDVLVKDTYR